MPRGGKPKVYDPELVKLVHTLYASGKTQAEVGAEIGLSQKVIWNLMRRHGLPRRPQVKRDQHGTKNAHWKGDGASYAALHKRVESARGTARRCDWCQADDPSKSYDWANLTGDYTNIEDFARLCRSCHRKHDNKRHRGGDA